MHFDFSSGFRDDDEDEEDEGAEEDVGNEQDKWDDEENNLNEI